jgi:scyllo-inositol 2-dehydrogenase (NADP+)
MDNQAAASASGRIRVAAVGAGWVCTHRHLPTMDRSSQFEVVGVVDRKTGRAEETARQRGYRQHACAARLADVPWIGEVDAVSIATAPQGHFAVASEALERGLHVMLEKPMAMTVEEGAALVDLARRTNRTFAIVHNFQFSRSARRLIADLESGRLGRARALMGVQLGNPRRRLPEWYETLPLGLFYDESPHLLYLLRRLSARPLELVESLTFPSTEGLRTPAYIHCEFVGHTADGQAIPATLRCSFESPVSEWYVMVQGDEALGVADVFRDIYVCLPNDGVHTTATVLRTSLLGTAQHWWQHVPSGIGHLRGTLDYGNGEVFARFARAVTSGQWDTPGIGATDALSVLTLQHQILQRSRSVV